MPASYKPKLYGIVAKVPLGSSKAQVNAMLQNLLAERFGLLVHHQVKEFDTYKLTVADGRGPVADLTGLTGEYDIVLQFFRTRD